MSADGTTGRIVSRFAWLCVLLMLMVGCDSGSGTSGDPTVSQGGNNSKGGNTVSSPMAGDWYIDGTLEGGLYAKIVFAMTSSSAGTWSLVTYSLEGNTTPTVERFGTLVVNGNDVTMTEEMGEVFFGRWSTDGTYNYITLLDWNPPLVLRDVAFHE